MPHIILEHSHHVTEWIDPQKLFDPLHHMLSECLPTELSSCKSRCILSDHVVIGDGRIDKAFVHVTLKILAGRSDRIKQQAGEIVISHIKTYFLSQLPRMDISFSVELTDLSPYYFKDSSL